METVTAQTSQLEISSPDLQSYGEAFHDIVAYIRQIRRTPLSGAELNVTRSLAGPFTCGGLLVILLEPLQRHPWHKGTDAVISECPTLSALREGLHIGSNGQLRFLHHVSVLDLRPFMSKEQNILIRGYQREKLYNLLMRAIDAKKPDVVLCMGQEPKTILSERHARLSGDLRKRVKWVNTMHPSYSVNYHEDDIKERTRLLRTITEACCKLGVTEDLSTPRQPAESQRDTRWIEILIWALIELCLRPHYRLPHASLMTNGFYQLEAWHNKYFVHVLSLPSAESDQDQKIAAALIPLFKCLNKCLKTTSWYLNAYEANWEGIVSVLTDGLGVLEGVCDLLDQKPFSSICCVNRLSYGEKDDIDGVLSHGERITFRMAALIHDEYPQPRRNCIWIGFAR